MTMRMASGLPARVIQVLKDLLPTELDLIDTEEGGQATPDIAADAYHAWARQLITKFPAVTVNVTGARAVEHQQATFGSTLHALYDVDVAVHVAAGGSDNPLRLQELCHRYAAGIYRVLANQKPMLETVADPVLYAHDTLWRSLSFGPESGQEGGEITRTAVLGFQIRKVESR